MLSNDTSQKLLLPQLLLRNRDNLGERLAYREKRYGLWRSWSWRQSADEIAKLAFGLEEIGLRAGHKVALIGTNRPQLYWAMTAIQLCGAIPVPFYADSIASEMQYLLDHTNSRMAIVEDQEQLDKLISIGSLPNLQAIIYVDPKGLRNYHDGKLHDFTDITALGQKRADQEKQLQEKIAAIMPGNIAIFLYTSGTTGNPKGVALTFANIEYASRVSCQFDKISAKEEVLAYLPMAWVGDFIFSIGQAYYAGYCVSCPEFAATVHEDLRELGPTYYFAPPRIFEAMLAQITIRIADSGAVQRWLYSYFIAHAQKFGEDILTAKPVGFVNWLLYFLGEKFVYGPLKNMMGLSRLRLAYTAGEAIGTEIFKFFRALGVNLKQLYGQTEASVFVTMHRDGDIRAETVGVAIPELEAKIDSDTGELLYRSPGVFLEYYRDHDATMAAKTADGWMHSGDAGFFTDDGHLTIIDRAKDVGKLENGGLFPPKYIENKLKFYSHINQAIVIGDGRPFVVAMINIDLSATGSWAERNSVTYASYSELAAHPRVCDLISEYIGDVNRSLADMHEMAHCQIHRFLVLHKELDADDGELTRTRKLRRSTIEQRYHPLIDALYKSADRQYIETEIIYEDGAKKTISADIQIHDARIVAAENKIAPEKPALI